MTEGTRALWVDVPGGGSRLIHHVQGANASGLFPHSPKGVVIPAFSALGKQNWATGHENTTVLTKELLGP